MWLLSFKEPEGQAARWLEALAEFNYDIIHRPGNRAVMQMLSHASCVGSVGHS